METTSTLHCRLYDSGTCHFDGLVREIVVTTSRGEESWMSGHQSMVQILTPGFVTISCQPSNDIEEICLKTGQKNVSDAHRFYLEQGGLIYGDGPEVHLFAPSVQKEEVSG